jgi:putative tricarboxylic transport membrane protein
LTFLTRPLSALFLALAVVSVIFSLYQNRKIQRLQADGPRSRNA